MKLFSFLGAANYDERVYLWDGEKYEGRFSAIACSKFVGAQELVLFMTQDAEEKNFEALDDEKRRVQEEDPNFQLEITPVNNLEFSDEEDNLWQLFDIISAQINSNDEIALDITNGPRAMPLTALMTLMFRKESLGNIFGNSPADTFKITHILYTGSNPDENHQVPTFDIVSMLALQNWAAATDLFLKKGYTSGINYCIEAFDWSTDNLFDQMEESRMRRRFIDKSFHLNEAYYNLRSYFYMDRAQAFEEELISLNNYINQRAESAPLLSLTEKIRADLQPIQKSFTKIDFNNIAPEDVDEIVTKEFLLIKKYLAHDMYIQAVDVASEWVINWFMVKLGDQLIAKEIHRCFSEDRFKFFLDGHDPTPEYFVNNGKYGNQYRGMYRNGNGRFPIAYDPYFVTNEEALAKITAQGNLRLITGKDNLKNCYENLKRIRNEIAHPSQVNNDEPFLPQNTNERTIFLNKALNEFVNCFEYNDDNNNPDQQRTKMLTFLGVPRLNPERDGYAEVEYQWNNESFTSFFASAAEAHFFSPDEITFFVTDDSKKIFFSEGMEDKHYPADDVPENDFNNAFNEICRINNYSFDAHFVSIGQGDNHWEIFNSIINAVGDQDAIILDLTNGLRTLPAVGILSLMFLQNRGNISIDKVLYGSFANIGHLTNHIFDLKNMALLPEWYVAVNRAIGFGDVSVMEAMVNRSFMRAPGQIDIIISTLKDITNGLALVMPFNVIESCTFLQNILNEALAEINEWAEGSPFRQTFELIRDSFVDFSVSLPEDADNMQRVKAQINAQRKIIDYYINHNMLYQTVLLTREWVISYVMYRDDDGDIRNRTKRDDYKNNQNFEEILGRVANRPVAGFNLLFEELSKIRHQFAHASFNPRLPYNRGYQAEWMWNATNVSKNCKELIQKVLDVCQPLI